MNVDEAMELFGPSKKKFYTLQSGDHFCAGETLACEVERLRGEVERLDVARLLGTALEVQRLRAELTIREQEVICVRNSQSLELANCKKDNERLRAELAAAKAASVVPVEIKSVYVNKYIHAVVVFIGDEKGAVEFDAWLCDRVKERGEG